MMKSALFCISTVMLGSASACSSSPVGETRYTIAFEALDDRRQGLSDIPIQVGETALGSTDAHGQLEVEVHAREGERFPLLAPCPSSHRATRDMPAELHFRLTKGLQGDEQTRMQVRIVCERRRRVAALLVHSDGYEGMPVLINGIARGRTGPEGFAHLRLDLDPGAQFEVALDSSARPELAPLNPSQTMTIGEEDGLFVFDPVFRTAPVDKKRSRRHRTSPAAKEVTVKRPLRID